MAYEIQRALERLNWEIQKDNLQTEEHKKKMIKEIISTDKSKIFTPIPKKKISLWTKILIIMGYGKKR
jgi:hypothetical protein